MWEEKKMKKSSRFLALLLCLAMAVSLVGCGKSEYVKNAEALINAIGEVTADSEEAILAAEKAFDALTAEDQAKVENAALLPQAREALEQALIEKAAAELEALRQSLLDSWRADIDISGMIADQVDEEVGGPVSYRDYVGEIPVTFYLCFYDDNTYRCFYDEESLENAFASLRASTAEYYRDLMRLMLIDEFSALDPAYDFEPEGALEDYIGMSLDEAMMAALGTDINGLVDIILGDDMVSAVRDESNREGKFFVEPGKLHTSLSLASEPTDGDYESFELDGDTLTLTSYAGTSALDFVYPLVFARES